MIKTAAIRPPNSLLFVMDLKSGEIPETMAGKLVVSTPSSIVVSTLTAADGETSVVLTDERSRVPQDLRKVWGGVIATPNKEVQVCTVLLQSILQVAVPNTKSNVEIWANNEIEPDRLCVLVVP